MKLSTIRLLWLRILPFSLFLLVVILAIVSSCRHSRDIGMQQSTTYQPGRMHNCITMPAGSSDAVYDGLVKSSVFSFYSSHNFKPFWIANGKLTTKADSMIAMVRSARFYGLLPQDYHPAEIQALTKHENCKLLLRLDALLTDAFLTMAGDLKQGRLDRLENDSLHFDLLAGVRNASQIRTTLESVEPVYRGYTLLKAALKKTLDTVNVVDKDLLLNGIILDSLEVHRKIQTMEINLERWRMEESTLPMNNYVWINIPAYTVSVFENDSLILRSKVIVGAPESPTPVISSMIECFIVYPYWHVPRKISVTEYLPVIRKDVSFITANNFDVLDREGNVLNPDSVEWEELNNKNFPVILRQREGPENSLGIVKFSFNNSYAVFLHDTNARRLFRGDMRALSHGCIRMEKAIDLAHYLAERYTENFTSKNIDHYIALKEKHTIELNTPLPIHIRYFTCEATGSSLEFYDDIYSKDAPMINSFYKSPPVAF